MALWFCDNVDIALSLSRSPVRSWIFCLVLPIKERNLECCKINKTPRLYKHTYIHTHTRRHTDIGQHTYTCMWCTQTSALGWRLPFSCDVGTWKESRALLFWCVCVICISFVYVHLAGTVNILVFCVTCPHHVAPLVLFVVCEGDGVSWREHPACDEWRIKYKYLLHTHVCNVESVL